MVLAAEKLLCLGLSLVALSITKDFSFSIFEVGIMPISCKSSNMAPSPKKTKNKCYFHQALSFLTCNMDEH